MPEPERGTPMTADANPAALAPQAPQPPQALCASADLHERGQAHVFDLLEYDRPVRGFVLRFNGLVVGYLNRCAHVPAEMDWQAGQFLDDSQRWIICSIHGAVYEPRDGLCVGGPCAGRRLTPLQVDERDGFVYWYPTQFLTLASSAKPAS